MEWQFVGGQVVSLFFFNAYYVSCTFDDNNNIFT